MSSFTAVESSIDDIFGACDNSVGRTDETAAAVLRVGMSTNNDAGKGAKIATTVHRSCDRCRLQKRKCDWDGVNACRCVFTCMRY